MDKYRIVEETGSLTKTKRYYIEIEKRKLFGGKKWSTYYEYHPEVFRKPLIVSNYCTNTHCPKVL